MQAHEGGLDALLANVADDIDAERVVAEAVTASQRDQIIHSLNECAMHHFPVEIAHSTFQVESISHAQHEHLQH